jgi:peptidyl-prolyl cis-trans isomerase C
MTKAMTFNRLLRDPLLHFALLGAAIFAVFALRGEPDADGRRIVVGAGDVTNLVQAMAMLYGRPPTEAEILALVEPTIREEILYREALVLGLDRDDTQVRQRLVEKMSFLSEDLMSAESPDEAALKAFFGDHSEFFEEPGRRAFEHLYFSPSEHGADIRSAAESALAALADANTGDVAAAYRAAARNSDAASRDELQREFGAEFAEALFAVPDDGAWHGPLQSLFGMHVVRIAERHAARRPPYEEVRDRVEAAYLAERRRLANESAYRAMRERYDVVIEVPDDLRQRWQRTSGE